MNDNDKNDTYMNETVQNGYVSIRIGLLKSHYPPKIINQLTWMRWIWVLTMVMEMVVIVI